MKAHFFRRIFATYFIHGSKNIMKFCLKAGKPIPYLKNLRKRKEEHFGKISCNSLLKKVVKKYLLFVVMLEDCLRRHWKIALP